jgi:hypothetical protein
MGEIDDVGGSCELKVDGVIYNTIGSLTIETGGRSSEPKMSRGKVVGYKVTDANPGKISGTIVDTNELDIVDLQQKKNATVTVKKPNGKTVVLRNACFSIVSSENMEEGEVSFEFQGDAIEEQKS